MASSKRLLNLLGEVKPLAREYYKITGRPLGVTAEIAEYEAARILKLKLSSARQSGCDAIRKTPRGDQRLQIKGRCILPGPKSGQRLGSINLKKEWDAVILVLLNEDYSPTAIYEADRPAITDAITAPGSRARNERGQLGISKFKSIGTRIWSMGRSG
jgi:hypothetical protein